MFLPMRRAAPSHSFPPVSPGFTLFELIVTLAVMSVVLALVGPALVLRHPSENELFANLVSDSRRAATRRAQALRLDLDNEGTWTLSSGPAGNPSIVESGHMSVAGGAARVRISPLGICMSEGEESFSIDPLTCVVSPARAP